MRFVSLLVALVWTTAATGAPLRPVARVLIDAAPDQETFQELRTKAPDADADDRKEENEARNSRLTDLSRVAEGSKSEITRASAYFESAQLLQESAAELRDQAIQTYRSEFDRWWIGDGLAEPELKLDGWREALLKRVNTLRDMASHFPRDPRIAEINWEIGSTMARLGNDHCEQYFKQATQLAKTPEITAKVKISRADWLMATGHVDEAGIAYGGIREGVSDELKAYATYRLGWYYLAKADAANAGERPDLLKKAEVALKLAYLTQKADQETRFKLHAESGRDLAWFWAVAGNESEAKAFFEKQGAKDLLAVFGERQADEWLRQRQVEKARAYFDAKAVADPEDPLLPDYHLKLAHAYVVDGDVQAVKRETEVLGKLVTDKENPWFDEHEDDEALMARAKKMYALLPLAAGFKLYEAADTEKDPKRKTTLLDASVRDLQEQVQTVKDPEQVLTIRVMLVKSLIALSRLPEALDQLNFIVKMGAKAGDRLAPAAFERLNILVKLDTDANYPALPEPGEVKAPLPLPDLKKRFAAAAMEYMQIVPDAEIVPNLKFQMANDLFAYGHYDEALTQLETFVVAYPKAEQARTAIETCLSMNLKKKNWEELVRLSTAFLNNRNVKGRELRNYIKENLDWAKEQVKGSAGDAPTVH